MARLFLLVCLLLAIFVKLGECLQCYSCQTLVGPSCNDPYNTDERSDELTDCDNGMHCIKSKTVVRIRDSGYIQGWERDSVVITRLCDLANDQPTGCVRWQNNGGFFIKCRCDSDGCNSAGLVRPGIVITVLTAIALAWFLR